MESPFTQDRNGSLPPKGGPLKPFAAVDIAPPARPGTPGPLAPAVSPFLENFQSPFLEAEKPPLPDGPSHAAFPPPPAPDDAPGWAAAKAPFLTEPVEDFLPALGPAPIVLEDEDAAPRKEPAFPDPAPAATFTPRPADTHAFHVAAPAAPASPAAAPAPRPDGARAIPAPALQPAPKAAPAPAPAPSRPQPPAPAPASAPPAGPAIRPRFFVTTTAAVDGHAIRAYLDVVSAEVVLPKDLLFRNPAPYGELHRLKAAEDTLQRVKAKAVEELSERAKKLGADAVVSVQVSFVNLDTVCCLCSAVGTAVKLA